MGQNHTMTLKGVGRLGTTALMESGLLHRRDSLEANLLCSSLLLQKKMTGLLQVPLNPSSSVVYKRSPPSLLVCLWCHYGLDVTEN